MEPYDKLIMDAIPGNTPRAKYETLMNLLNDKEEPPTLFEMLDSLHSLLADDELQCPQCGGVGRYTSPMDGLPVTCLKCVKRD